MGSLTETLGHTRRVSLLVLVRYNSLCEKCAEH